VEPPKDQEQDDDLVFIAKDEAHPLIPEGSYNVIFHRHNKCRYFGGGFKLYIIFKLSDPGQWQGTKLFRAYNFSEPLSRGTNLYKDFVLLRGVRARKGERFSLNLFKNKILEVEVRTVKEDRNQVALPEHQHYSVIRKILRVAVGPEGIL
jgi:hypothetical protein